MDISHEHLKIKPLQIITRDSLIRLNYHLKFSCLIYTYMYLDFNVVTLYVLTPAVN